MRRTKMINADGQELVVAAVFDYSDPSTADLLPVCEFEPDNRKYFEYRMSPDDTVLCRYYPHTGTYISLETNKFVASEGRPDFDGRAMAKKMHDDRREAVLDGLSLLAQEKGLGVAPVDAIREIVKRQAQQAMGDGRDATNAAKFVLAVYDQSSGTTSDKPTVSVEIPVESMEKFFNKLFKEVE